MQSHTLCNFFDTFLCRLDFRKFPNVFLVLRLTRFWSKNIFIYYCSKKYHLSFLKLVEYKLQYFMRYWQNWKKKKDCQPLVCFGISGVESQFFVMWQPLFSHTTLWLIKATNLVSFWSCYFFLSKKKNDLCPFNFNGRSGWFPDANHSWNLQMPPSDSGHLSKILLKIDPWLKDPSGHWYQLCLHFITRLQTLQKSAN